MFKVFHHQLHERSHSFYCFHRTAHYGNFTTIAVECTVGQKISDGKFFLDGNLFAYAKSLKVNLEYLH